MASDLASVAPVGYVDAPTLRSISELAREIKSRISDMLGVEPGDRVLDVGCGPGLDTAGLAGSAASSGYVVGMDRDAQMVTEAETHRRQRNAAVRLAHVAGDGLALPFLDEVFDRCRCERMLQHVNDPAHVVAELFRVTSSDGTAVVADTDWASLSVDCDDRDLERRIMHAVSNCFADGYAGREIARLMRAAGFDIAGIDVRPLYWTSWEHFRTTSFTAAGVVPSLISSGRLAAADWHRFVELLEQSDRNESFFASASVIVVAGCKRSRKVRRHA
jgi:ubiquinone/menaquinone biosynthesis C-methylase UbiE